LIYCFIGILERFEPLSWHLAFQSKAGGSEKWIGPDVESVLIGLSKIYVKEVLVVPVGFVSDHIEILYDLDLFYREKAQSLGLTLRRAPSLNDSERFIEALARVIEAHLKGFEPPRIEIIQ
jgi:ferrochelatase